METGEKIMREFVINANDSGQRIDKFISKAMPDMPKSMMYKLIRKKDIKLNGKRCELSQRLSEGDVVRVYVKEELSSPKEHDMSFLNASSSLDIVYEDSNMIIVSKPVGLETHPSYDCSGDTLIDRIKKYLWEKKEYLPDSESSFAPAVCSRLDRNTSGLVTAAKNAAALREINSAIREGRMHKIYRCVCISPLPKSEDVLTAYHKKDTSRNTVSISDLPGEGYKEIRTGYKVLRQNKGLSLVEVTLFTGRTHQIRAHLAHIGSPLLGDGKYGDTAFNKRMGVFHQALCAYAVSFEFPEDSPLSSLNGMTVCAASPDFEKKYFGIS